MPASILQNKFGGVDERNLPQKGEDFIEINGVFPRFAGLQNRLLGKKFGFNANDPVYNIYQAWSPFGYVRSFYQLKDSVLTDVFVTPNFSLGGGGTLIVPVPPVPPEPVPPEPVPPPVPVPPVTVDPVPLEKAYEVMAGNYEAHYEASYPGYGNGSSDPHPTVPGLVPVPYVSQGAKDEAQYTPPDSLPKIPLTSIISQSSGGGFYGGYTGYHYVDVYSSGHYISNVTFDIRAWGYVSRAILYGTETALQTDGSTVTSFVAKVISGGSDYITTDINTAEKGRFDDVHVEPHHPDDGSEVGSRRVFTSRT